MIRAHFLHEGDELCGFLLQGHADSGEYGHDIVCAAVSALAINTVNSLEQLAAVSPQIVSDDENGGYLKVTLNKSEYVDHSAQLLLNSLHLGLSSIADNYQKYLIIEHKQV